MSITISYMIHSFSRTTKDMIAKGNGENYPRVGERLLLEEEINFHVRTLKFKMMMENDKTLVCREMSQDSLWND